MKELWIVGKTTGCECDKDWEFGGIFETEELAIRACFNDYYFIAPVSLNELIPDETQKWEGCYYPLLQDRNGNPIEEDKEEDDDSFLVTITKCSGDLFWYKDRIGEVFRIKKITNFEWSDLANYHVDDVHYIKSCDCERIA